MVLPLLSHNIHATVITWYVASYKVFADENAGFIFRYMICTGKILLTDMLLALLPVF